jgi:glutathione S-transferase
MVILEKGLGPSVEVVAAQTRTAGSPYYRVNPSGRVPYLEIPGKPGLEDSQLIVAYLDHISGPPSLMRPWADDDWLYGRLEATARSFTDGLSVWVRELRRPEGERSPGIIAHERQRAERLADQWEQDVSHPLMTGSINLAQLYLLAGLDQAAHWGIADHAASRPALAAWLTRMHKLPSAQATAPAVPI